MIREILYRAKRIENDGWVYGSHLFDQVIGKHYIVLPRNITESYTAVNPDGEFKRLHCTGIEVVPETVRQYTGLKDKNGKKIFEGDICRDSLDTLFVVEWDKKNARFIGFIVGNECRIIYVGREPKVEVIGNIFDNPELLEVE